MFADNEVEENFSGKHSSEERSSGQRFNSISTTVSRPIATPATSKHAPKAETQKCRRSGEVQKKDEVSPSNSIPDSEAAMNAKGWYKARNKDADHIGEATVNRGV